MRRLLGLLFFLPLVLEAQNGVLNQLSHERVRAAQARTQFRVSRMFLDSGLSAQPKYIYWRAFKLEDQLELWGSDSSIGPYKLLKTYYVCQGSGDLGPKRKFGDRQVPEGLYYIERFNPNSNYHLSLKVSYPNEADLVHADKQNPGNEIYIHGSCVSIGCLPMTDSAIEEIYWISLSAQAYQGAQAKIPIDIYPCRFNPKNWSYLNAQYGSKPGLIPFWKNIEEAYKFFNKHKVPPGFWVDDDGKYRIVFPQNFHLFSENH